MTTKLIKTRQHSSRFLRDTKTEPAAKVQHTRNGIKSPPYTTSLVLTFNDGTAHNSWFNWWPRCYFEPPRQAAIDWTLLSHKAWRVINLGVSNVRFASALLLLRLWKMICDLSLRMFWSLKIYSPFSFGFHSDKTCKSSVRVKTTPYSVCFYWLLSIGFISISVVYGIEFNELCTVMNWTNPKLVKHYKN